MTCWAVCGGAVPEGEGEAEGADRHGAWTVRSGGGAGGGSGRRRRRRLRRRRKRQRRRRRRRKRRRRVWRVPVVVFVYTRYALSRAREARENSREKVKILVGRGGWLKSPGRHRVLGFAPFFHPSSLAVAPPGHTARAPPPHLLHSTAPPPRVEHQPWRVSEAAAPNPRPPA
jgi:hypothetical protein